MNSKQLVILWYAALVATGYLIFYAAENHRASFWPVLFAVAIVAGALIYSLMPHPKARKVAVAAWVIGPPSAVACLFLFLAYKEYVSQRHAPAPNDLDLFSLVATPGDLELFDADLSLQKYPCRLTARVRNRSKVPVSQLTIRIKILSGESQVDGTDAVISFRVPVPVDEVRSFETDVDCMHPPIRWAPSYQIVRVR